MRWIGICWTKTVLAMNTTSNFLNLPVKEIKESRTEFEYCFRVLILIHHLFPKGYIEWKALCYHLYEARGKLMIDRLKNARFSVDEPMQIGWEEGAGRVFADRVVFALLTINRSASFERMQLFERAYEKLVQMKKETE